MYAALEHALSAGAAKAIVVGSDIPDVSATLLQAAAAALDQHEVVLGPAHDGGFYLIGATRTAPAMLQGITWSAATVREATAAQLHTSGLSVAPEDALPALLDIDTVQDMRTWVDVQERRPAREAQHPVLAAAEDALQCCKAPA
ncbi:hypothetical protein WJX81_007333 [Elliptochloris bilobata]|uniref:Glycosyltransferase n=1 Tax=Elliptochloris bilobata TaxID=381761 RepID=A0AAW1RSG8_9CHLO